MLQNWSIIVILLLIFSTLNSQPTFQATDTRTGQLTMTPTSAMLWSTPSAQYTATYLTAYASAPTQQCIGVVGYNTQVTNDFTFNITVYSVTTTNITFTLTVYGDMSLNMLSINYLTISSTNTDTQILSECFSCITLNSGNDYRFQMRNLTTSFTYGQLAMITTLSGFQLANSVGVTDYLRLQTFQVSLTQIIQTIFQTDGNNTFNSICYNVIIFNQYISGLNQMVFGYLNYKSLSNVTTGDFLNQTNTLMNIYKIDNSIYFGMSGFRTNNMNGRLFFVDTTNNLSNLLINYQSNWGTEEVVISFFWRTERVLCTSSQYYYAFNESCISQTDCVALNMVTSATGMYCSNCDYSCSTCTAGTANDCSTCDATQLRTLIVNLGTGASQCQCVSGTIDYLFQTLCLPCNTIISNCQSCTMVNYAINCTTCGNYLSVVVGGYITQCICPIGYFQSYLICINTTGCINYTLVNNTYSIVRCNYCDTTLNFQPNSNSSYICQCSSGYYLNINACQNICGDEILVNPQQCDDGNNVNGDGCSSTCYVQSGWYCSNITLQKSICALNYQLQLSYVRRVTTANTMEVGLTVTPSNLPFTIQQLESTISHDIPVNSFYLSYSSGDVIIDFNYNQTIEGNYYTINFTLNSSSPSQIQSIIIPALGMNAALTYDQYYSHNQYLQILIIVLDCLALVVLSLSIFSQRIIGIEMIQTLQTVFFSMAYLTQTPNQLSSLQYLRYSNGYNMYSGDNYGRIYPQNFGTSSLGIQQQFLASFNIMLLILLSIMLALVILKIVYSCISNSQSKTSNLKIKELQQTQKQIQKNRIVKASNFIFQKLLFLIALLCLFTIIFAFGNQMNDVSINSNVLPIQLSLYAAFISMMIEILIFTSILLNYFFPTYELIKFPHLPPQYPIIYISLQLTFILTLTFSSYQSDAIFSVFILSIINIIMVIIVKPYPTNYHNIALIYHQIVIIISNGFYCFSILTTYTTGQQLIYLVGCYLIVALLYGVLIWDSIRLWKWRNQNLLKQDQKKQEKEYTKQHLKGINKKGNKVGLSKELEEMEGNNEEHTFSKINGKDFQWFYNVQQQLQIEKQKKQQQYYLDRYHKNKIDQDNELKQLKSKLKQNYHERELLPEMSNPS